MRNNLGNVLSGRDVEEAERLLRLAVAGSEALHAAHRDETNYQHDLAKQMHGLAGILRAHDRLDEAVTCMRGAVALQGDLNGAGADSDYAESLARHTSRLANYLSLQGGRD